MDTPPYPIHPGVRARSEDFGLLFYNTADTSLTFVKCGSSLQLSYSYDYGMCVTGKYEKEKQTRKVKNVLKRLLEKGLIVETGNRIQQ